MNLSNFEIIAAVVIGVLSVARTARLLVWDDYPPTMWLRMKWDDKTHESAWNKLFHCQFCITPYLAAGLLAWFWFSDAHWTWWVANGVWAASYVAATYVAYDQPDD